MATPQDSLAETGSALVANVTSGTELPETQSAFGAITGGDMLIYACIALGLIAMASIAVVLKNRQSLRDTARIARMHAQESRQLFSTMRMAESLAGIGVWQFDPVSRAQSWSDGMKRLFGLEGVEDFVAGDAETLLMSYDVDLVGRIQQHKDKTHPFSLEFQIPGPEDEESKRIIAVQACNLRGEDGAVSRVVAVASDATEQVEREKELENSRKEAVSQAREARILADTDPLTGLANRRRVMAELDRRVIDSKTSGVPLVLIMFDIDRLEQINDKYGEDAGDKVLQRVSRLASAQARENDLLGRVGGEEFVLILAGSSEGMARIMSERLRQGIANCSSVGELPPVTISLGYTSLQSDDTALSLFARADGALYEAKHSGRNRVRMAA